MYILGISCFYHDAAACLLKDGKIVACAEEERFTRKKHDSSFPFNAIKFCLDYAKINIDEVDYVGFYEKPLLKFERLLFSYIETYPKSIYSFFHAMPSWLNQKLRIPGIVRRKLKYKGNVLFVKHHMVHAASAYLCSPFKEAAFITLDGVGEWATSGYGVAEDNDIKTLKEIHFPDSLGLLYSTVTAYLGFKVNNDEYKVMGLAAYGKPTYYDKFLKLVDIKEDGSFKLNMDYFCYKYRLKMFNKKFINLFGHSPRVPESKMEKHYEDIAASLQKVTEEIILNMVNHVYDVTKKKYLCLAGGVGLNSVANGKILENMKFKDIFVQPAAGDAGGAIGVAKYIYHILLRNEKMEGLKDVYFGPAYSNEEVKKFLDKNNIKYEELDDKELIKKVAKLIYENNIIGWFQGRMEYGPRALGNRSILSNACNPEMKDILNLKVKHREEFRPFAPVAPLDEAGKYFEISREIPYMLFVCNVKEDKRRLIPAVTHVDGSARLQTIKREVNPRYYDLIKEFKKYSQVPVLINTSFNIRGEPIVCSPKDAYNCFKGTDIDYLIMNNFIVKK